MSPTQGFPASTAPVVEEPYVPMAGYGSTVVVEGQKLKRGEKERQIRRNNPFAYTGLLLSILALLINPFAVLSILGIVFSSVGLAKSLSLDGRTPASGKGMSITGLILGVLSLLYVGWKVSSALS